MDQGYMSEDKRATRTTYSIAEVRYGDIIDLREAEIVEKKNGEKNLRAVVRSKNGIHHIQMFAEELNFVTARVANILEVRHYPQKMRNGKWVYRTDIFVKLENAFGETPNIVADNTEVHRVSQENVPKKSNGDEPAMPDFTYGGVKNAEEEG